MFSTKKAITTAAMVALLPVVTPTTVPAAPLISQLLPPPVFSPAPVPVPVPTTPTAPVPHLTESESAVGAHILLMMAMSAEENGKSNEAIRLYKQVVEDTSRLFGLNLDAAVAAGRMGTLYGNMHRFDEANRWSSVSLIEYEALEGANSVDVAISLNNLAWVKEQLGQAEAAEKAYKRALSVLYALPADDDNDELIGICENNLGDFLHDRHRAAESVNHYQFAYAHFQKVLGDSHPLTKMVQRKLKRVAHKRS